jgi:hypothetical protein
MTWHHIHQLTSGSGGKIAFGVCVLFLLYVGVTSLMRSR